jgi:hypothetical protein
MSVHSRSIKMARELRRARLLIAVLVFTTAAPLCAWGPRAHRLITEKAVDELPAEIKTFYIANRSYLADHSFDAKNAANKSRAEAVRHFIYFDRYGKYPFPLLPHNYNVALQTYGGFKLNRNGILPWYIGEYHLRLTQAFRSHNWEAVREASAWLAHYVADVADPFHLTENDNGQLSGQNGIDDRIGTGLFDRYANFLLLRPAPVEYLRDPTENAFQLALQNFVWVDNYLLADRRAFGAAGKFNDEYYERLYNEIGSIISREVSEAIQNVSSYWYTAWVNAGKPALPAQ